MTDVLLVFFRIMKLHEHGVIDAIKKRYIARGRQSSSAYNVPSSLAIDMDRVFFIFAVLCLGILASMVICVVENIVFALNKHETVESVIRQFPDIKRIISDRKKRPCGCSNN